MANFNGVGSDRNKLRGLPWTVALAQVSLTNFTFDYLYIYAANCLFAGNLLYNTTQYWYKAIPQFICLLFLLSNITVLDLVSSITVH